MDFACLLLWLLTLALESVSGQGVYAPPTVSIMHSGQACNIEEERYTERVYTIREGETLELTCLVRGHPRPQIRWTKTAGSASDRFHDNSVFNETLRITKIQRHQGGRYYCKADNGLSTPAIKSIRVDVYYLDDPVLTIHHSIGEAKELFYFERTVFLRCSVNSNPPVRYSWRRGREILSQGSDKGIEIYEPFFTQGEIKILKLKNLRPLDYANYSCIASVRNVCNIPDKMVSFKLSNATGPEHSTEKSGLKIDRDHQASNQRFPASPSIKLLVPEHIVVNPGDSLSMVCVTTGGDPPPTLTWIKAIGPLPKTSVLKGGTLTLHSINVEEAGAYSCLANNNVGNPAKKSSTITVRALKKGRFWITPDPYHDDDNIQIGREVKISCQVEAIPPDELTFSWFKNGRPLRSSERMVISTTDPDVSPGTTSLDIIDLRFTDFGTYTCVASLNSQAVPDISIDVNISSSTVPPTLSVPKGRSPMVTREGDTVELQCLVSGKPKPIILWSRFDKEKEKELPMPDGTMQMESYDGLLRIVNVSRDMNGIYKCQTSQYNGFNVKPREAAVQLIVQYPPSVEPTFLEIRQGQGRSITMTCRVLKAYPTRVLTFEWKLGNKILLTGRFESQDYTQIRVDNLSKDSYGVYNCSIINEAGAGTCSFLVTGKAYPPEFYYDTPNPLWQNRARVYSYMLQWTQMNPNAVDRILAYRLGIRQTGQQRWWEQEISMNTMIQSGELITHNLTELLKPEAYEVRLTPITRFGEGDSTIRVIKYTDAPMTNPHLGFYMYIETSRPRTEGEKARLLSPIFSTLPKNPYGSINSAYCVSFYYNMYGKHIGTLNVFLRFKGFKGSTVTENLIWTMSGNQGEQWMHANININPSGTFQLIFEGIRGPSIEGDIAIDDVTVTEGECRKVDQPVNNLKTGGEASVLIHLWLFPVTLLIAMLSHRR
ncbi:MAM domain-containing glycosylphosphatidylinositol anchor protein 2 isoform X5 [Chiloscyllium plagiosum]|uniref:MAM domain-containing glycosylphosphatidylinositol anchor protein 2 isoform X5 n=1 Tax=Chiloscyllium plagiosum TaxID=36176 RepID=UPI001CB8129E|nr:MAM domain-containing glycosylphosphatidylinositol anchor protein 2 isoform X5 [Chiloscyllium plagiosum]